MPPKEATYTITRACFVNGEPKAVGAKVTLPEGEGNYLVAINKAVKGDVKLESEAKGKAKKD